ncbi:MAG: hypothetical protein RL318_2237 [Fibrobacterota bacterium]|jgi:uncharacterized protein (TIGR02147 family)
MIDLYQYTDYRAFLRDWIVKAKETFPAMSYRYLALRLELDQGFLVHIFHGQKHLAEKHVPGLMKILKLKGRDAQYFQRLVAFCKAKGERDIAQRFLELMELRESKVREVSSREHRYYAHWYVPAIRCLLAAVEFRGDWSELAQKLRPVILPEEAKAAVKLLESLGMVRLRTDGVWETLDAHLSSGDAWTGRAVRGFQKQTLQLAMQALEDAPKEEREISTLTFAIPAQEMPALTELVRDFRSRLARWALAAQEADRVYQMNIQIFPVSGP